jgi:alkanesulfonate monooxygenase SsuD/methylene tetrahydromethanopterin reductase-like flavin-dependent oxidoreductase (luciferase family)
VSQLVPYVQAYRAAYRAAGHPGDGGVFLRVPVYVAETAEQAFGEPQQSIVEYFRGRGIKSSRRPTQAGGDARGNGEAGSEEPGPITWDELLEERVVVGTPKLVTERLRELRDRLGLDGILAEVNSGGRIPRPLVRRSLRLLCEEVMPACR